MIQIDAVEDGLSVTDVVEETHYRIETGRVSPERVGVDALPTPVDEAVAVSASTLRLPNVVDCYLREPDGTFSHAVTDRETPVAAAALLETTTAPMKLYLRFDGPATVVSDERETRLRFEGGRDVVVGARSAHRRPVGSVTVPRTPAGLARGVSLFGSALKTTSAERSFPTLRGHPPLVEYGREFDAGGFERPGTGIRIEVPADYESVFTVASLAYYLGARVDVGADRPRLVVDGEAHSLGGDLREAAADTLRRCFLLDCITRTEGLYPVSLHERERVADRTAIDPERWYDSTLAERTAAYLSVPKDALAGLLEWHLTADVEPVPQNAEILPFVANDLAFVRSPAPTAGAGAGPEAGVAEPDELSDFFRGTVGRSRDIRRGTRATQNADAVGESVVSPVETDTYGHIWVGEHFPMGAAKPTVDAYRRRLRKGPGNGSVTSVTMVCNDAEMLEEADEGLYGFFDMISFDVERHYDLTTDELRAVLREDTNFLHYVGHVEDEGIRCADGYLDVETLESTGVDAFLLNGCQSYEQGQKLVNAGAYGGVVTLTSVGNRKATRTGRHLAHLLDVGFDFFGALDVVRRTQISRKNYVVVGDGRITISQSDSGAPILLELVEPTERGSRIAYTAYLSGRFRIGTMSRPYADGNGANYLSGGKLDEFDISTEYLTEKLTKERIPILVDGQLRWTNQVDESLFRGPR